MKYTAQQILNAIKKYPENLPSKGGGKRYWVINETGAVYTLGWGIWYTFIGWFIDIPGAPEELKPLPYPQNKPDKEGKYVCHDTNNRKWNPYSWYKNKFFADEFVDFFIPYCFEEEEEMEEKNILDWDKKEGLVYFNVDEMDIRQFRAICEKFMDDFGYTITNRQPEIAPCPFCGGECEVDIDASDGTERYSLGCKDMKCRYFSAFSYTPEEAIEKHNQLAEKVGHD